MSPIKFRIALSALALALLPLAEAKAILITVTSITKNAGDTANFSQNNTANAGEWQSQVSTISSGVPVLDVVGNIATAKTRYASVLGSDSNALNFASRSDNATSNYSVSFTVNALASVSYTLTINTQRLGALVVREEGGSAGVADITGVTGTISSPSTGTLNLPDIAGLNSNATLVTQINQSANAFVTGPLSGVTNFTLNFTWAQNTSSGNNIATGGDEGVVLLGLAGPAALIGAADDYPGTSGRSPQANDGHFVNISAQVLTVPEPATFMLAAMGAVGLGMVCYRRRRAS